MVIVALINNERNLGRARSTARLKVCHFNERIISENAGQHIGARFRNLICESVVASGGSGLMKGGAAVALSLTAGHLARIKHIHRIGKAIVRLTEGLALVPQTRIKIRLGAREGCLCRAIILVNSAIGLSFQGWQVACYSALALVWFTRFVKE
jgi:hypothetical protein